MSRSQNKAPIYQMHVNVPSSKRHMDKQQYISNNQKLLVFSDRHKKGAEIVKLWNCGGVGAEYYKRTTNQHSLHFKNLQWKILQN